MFQGNSVAREAAYAGVRLSGFSFIYEVNRDFLGNFETIRSGTMETKFFSQTT